MKKKRFIKVIKKLLKVLPLSFWLILIFAFDEPYVAILTLISAFAHELGHMFAFLILSKRFIFFGVASGLRLTSQKQLSYTEELIIALFGPLSNIILFLAVSPFIVLGAGEYAAVFGIINLFTAISNLILIEGYDGYRIAKCFINQYSSLKELEVLLRALSFFLSVILSLIALYLIRSFDGGYWIFFIFIASVFKAITSDSSVFVKGKR